MRQVGVLAAPGIVALKQYVPLLKLDHARVRRIAQAIADINSKNFLVEIEKVETNFFLVKVKSDKITVPDVITRLQQVLPAEIGEGIVDDEGNGIVVKAGPLGFGNIRLCCYMQINDEMVELAVKKLVYVIREFDKKF